MMNLKKWTICGLAAMMLMTGCSKKTETPTEAETTEASLAGDEVRDFGEVTKLGDYKGIEVTRMTVEVTDEELDAKIQDILSKNPERVAVTDRAAQDGDIANIDFVGLLDGVAFDGGTSEGYDLELGSGAFIAGFEEGIIGANVGDELSLNLTFPENYGSTDLAGKAVVFEVTVNSLEIEKESVLDNNFVQRMSDFTTVDEFKADTLADLEVEKAKLADQQIANDAFQAAIQNSEYNINQESFDAACDEYVNMYLQRYGMELDDYLGAIGQTEEEFRAAIKDAMDQNVKWQLLIEAIAEKEGLTVGDEDVQKLADEYQATLEELKANFADEKALLDEAKGYKVYRLIVDNAVVK